MASQMSFGVRRKCPVLIAILLLVLVGAAGGEGKSEAAPSASATSRPQVEFWYDWTGTEEQRILKALETLNNTQTKVSVKPVYFADVQKWKVAIAAKTGPDLCCEYSPNLGDLAAQGILEPLNAYVERDKLNFSDYIAGVLDGVTYKGKMYGIPHEVTFFMMYYNKSLLKKAGFSKPPLTFSEMYDVAVKTTKTDTAGNIMVLGFPAFSKQHYLPNMTYALGGRMFSPDGKYTPDCPQSLAALKMVVAYYQKFGVDNVKRFVEAGKYCDASDPFITDTQTLRFDGPWLARLTRMDYGVGPDKLDFDIAPLPYPDGHPELANGGEISSGVYFMSAASKQKDASWEVLKWIDEGNWNKLYGSFSARKSVLADPVFADVPGFKNYAVQAMSKNLAATPLNSKTAEISKAYNDAIELAMNLKITPEEALKTAAAQGNKLLGK